jgi:hypothetical protein
MLSSQQWTVRGGRADAPADAGAREEGVRPRAPTHADKHGLDCVSAERPGQVHQGRADAPANARAQEEGVRARAPTHASEHERASFSADQPGQVRGGRADAPADAGARQEGVGPRAPKHEVITTWQQGSQSKPGRNPAPRSRGGENELAFFGGRAVFTEGGRLTGKDRKYYTVCCAAGVEGSVYGEGVLLLYCSKDRSTVFPLLGYSTVPCVCGRAC